MSTKSKRKLKTWRAEFTEAQTLSLGYSYRTLERSWRALDPTKETLATSFTVKEDGDEWFVILHGKLGFEKMVMFFRCGNLLSLGATLEQQIAQGKWMPDKYS